jgi:hypothetical protein
MFYDLDLSRIPDENTRELIGRLLNLIEKQAADLRDAQAEIQRLRDEVNRLKGEQGKPKIKGNTPKPPAADHSSEKERKKARQRLETEFDHLFARKTGYEALDQRMAKTQAKKESLLLVLKYPELPLHNNAAELGVRQRVRKRDVSFGPRTQAGMRAWDTFATLAETSKKLGVSFYQYIHDRISEENRIPPMADLVTKAAKDSIWAGLLRLLEATPIY